MLWLTKGLGFGGAERLLVSAATHLDRRRYEVEVAYVLPEKWGMVPELTEAGARVDCLGRAGRPLAWLEALWLRLRRGRYDLLHTHSPVAAAAARLLAPAGLPIVHTEHNVWPRYRRATRWANAATYGRNRVVLAVSDHVAQSIRPPRSMPWVAVPTLIVLIHGIDPAKVQHGSAARAEARRVLNLAPDSPVIGSVANFTPKKDQYTMLQAVADLATEVKDVQLVLIGSGPLQAALEAQATQLGIADRTLFTGLRDDVPALLPAFDVFCLTSMHEGLSIALVEALAAGLPAVATRAGGIPEVLTHQREGLLVRPRAPEATAAALRQILTDPALRHQMGAAAQARARDFSIVTAVRRLEDIYDDVLAG